MVCIYKSRFSKIRFDLACFELICKIFSVYSFESLKYRWHFSLKCKILSRIQFGTNGRKGLCKVQAILIFHCPVQILRTGIFSDCTINPFTLSLTASWASRIRPSTLLSIAACIGKMNVWFQVSPFKTTEQEQSPSW